MAAQSNLAWRHKKAAFFKNFCIAVTGFAVLVLCLLIYQVSVLGLPWLDAQFLFHLSQNTLATPYMTGSALAYPYHMLALPGKSELGIKAGDTINLALRYTRKKGYLRDSLLRKIAQFFLRLL